MGYDVEIDVWLTEEGWFLGHDKPQYEIEIDLREALLQSKEIGIKMATIWLLCLMLVIALSIPIQIIFLLDLYFLYTGL